MLGIEKAPSPVMLSLRMPASLRKPTQAPHARGLVQGQDVARWGGTEKAVGVVVLTGGEVVDGDWSVQDRRGQSLAALLRAKWLPPDGACGGMSQRGGRARDKFLPSQPERPRRG